MHTSSTSTVMPKMSSMTLQKQLSFAAASNLNQTHQPSADSTSSSGADQSNPQSLHFGARTSAEIPWFKMLSVLLMSVGTGLGIGSVAVAGLTDNSAYTVTLPSVANVLPPNISYAQNVALAIIQDVPDAPTVDNVLNSMRKHDVPIGKKGTQARQRAIIRAGFMSLLIRKMNGQSIPQDQLEAAKDAFISMLPQKQRKQFDETYTVLIQEPRSIIPEALFTILGLVMAAEGLFLKGEEGNPKGKIKKDGTQAGRAFFWNQQFDSHGNPIQRQPYMQRDPSPPSRSRVDFHIAPPGGAPRPVRVRPINEEDS